MRFCDSLSDRGRVNWWKLCREYGVSVPKEKDERRIHVEGKMEDLEEIAKLMAQRPGYTMESRERDA